jgi:hypothetical protein
MIRVYEIESKVFQDIKKILEEQERMEEKDGVNTVIINEFARAGYSLRDGKSLGIKESCNYLYIKADEEFFKKNEPKILKDGVKKLEGEELEKVKLAMESEADSAAAGVGAIFGDF